MTPSSGPLHPRTIQTIAALAPGTTDAVAGARPAAIDQRVPRLCPFLLDERGQWRQARPSRRHICAAVAPPGVIAPAHQATMCLTPGYVACSSYRSAAEPGDASRSGGAASPGRTSDATRWSLARTTPVLLDRPSVAGLLSETTSGRRRRRDDAAAGSGRHVTPAVRGAAPMALVAVALVAIVAGGSPGLGDRVGAGQSTVPASTRAGAAGVVPPHAAPDGNGGAEAGIAAQGGAVGDTTATDRIGSFAPAASSRPLRWIVTQHETLESLAARHDTTIEAIREANGLDPDAAVEVGQVLFIP